MTAASEYASSASVSIEHRPWWRSRFVLSAAIAGVMIVCYFVLKSRYPWPASLEWNSLVGYLDRFQTWLSNQSNAPHPNLFVRVLNGISSGLDTLVTWIYDALTKITWVGASALLALIALRFGGIRAGVIMLGMLGTFGAVGLWDESMQTLALMLTAVSLSLAFGMPLGVAAGRSDRFNRFITPVLDAMQIVPAFAYLMPVVILFSVGPGAAVITTMIYAIPPAIRITALGIRGVSTNTVEAATAMGSTAAQTLRKVQLPLARRMLLLSVNQTILYALSMVVIAGLIGGSGLGDSVTTGLYQDPALAIIAGMTIVVIAIALDRVTEAIANRSDPSKRHLTEATQTHLRLLTLGAAGVVAVAAGLGTALGAAHVYSRWSAQDWLRKYVQKVLDYIANPSTFLFRHITNPIADFLVRHMLLPLDRFMTTTPWFVTFAGFVAIAFVISGLRPAITAAVMFVMIGAVGEWGSAMDTFSQVLVATVIGVVLGVALGVWAAENTVVSRVLRPINDVLQTLPQLVYIIPCVYLFPVSYVPGLIASVLYAFPVVARLVERGIRDVAPNTVEAAGAFGATRRQILFKVKIPLARDAIMLGVNQGVIMTLAVVVIAGLVGSTGLGYEVVVGLQRNEFGSGVVASIALLALGIVLDRVTQGSRRSGKGV
jgi:glycine betaine/proline transport system permease protein